jgi:hypothetical protein
MLLTSYVREPIIFMFVCSNALDKQRKKGSLLAEFCASAIDAFRTKRLVMEAPHGDGSAF